jgi:nickel-dependent lactate racemase
MQMALGYGRQQWDVDVPAANVIAPQRHPAAPSLADPAAALRAALEQPLGFPPLRRALTPDDHVAVVVDEQLAALPVLLPPLLEHLRDANVRMDAVTLVCAPPSTGQRWLEELPDEFQDVHVEVHQPDDRKKLAYLATMRQGRRLYLNRTVVDADQTVVLTRRGYDSLLGYAGAAGAIFPTLSDEATLHELRGQLSLTAPGGEPWKLQREAAEAVWLLGVPFLVQVIEGADGTVLHILGGPAESSAAGEKLLDERWRVEVDEPADVVIASVSGDPARHTFADLARAFATACRVVAPAGAIALLTDALPNLGPSAALLRQHEDPAGALKQLLQENLDDLEAGYLWASAAQRAKLYLLSRLPMEVAEELFTTPLDNVAQARKLLRGRCLFLPDAHRSLAVVGK